MDCSMLTTSLDSSTTILDPEADLSVCAACPRSLSLFSANCRSLLPKMDELQ